MDSINWRALRRRVLTEKRRTSSPEAIARRTLLAGIAALAAAGLSDIPLAFAAEPSGPPASASVAFASIAELRANRRTALLVYVESYHGQGPDGGEGHFLYRPADTKSPDNGGTIIVDAAGHRYYRERGGRPNRVRWFGAGGDGDADDTAAIQAAIDDTYARGEIATYLPTGRYRTTAPIYLDAPGNLRRDLRNPTIFGFSLALIGEAGLPHQPGRGSQISPTRNDFAAIWVGPGSGMHVKSIHVAGPRIETRAAASPQGAGIAIASGSGGATRSLIEDVAVERYRFGIATGFNGNGSLGDGTTILKPWINNCHTAVAILQTQNYINSIIEGYLSQCTRGVVAEAGTPVEIIGGSYGLAGDEISYATLGIGQVSALTATPDIVPGAGAITNASFSARFSAAHPALDHGDFNAFCILTPGFGPVPLLMTRYETASRTGHFKLYPAWVSSYFGFTVDLTKATALEAELQAATRIDCCEWVQIFRGSRLHVVGTHHECPSALTTLMAAGVDPAFAYSSGGNRLAACSIRDAFLNYDPCQNPGITLSNDAVFHCQQVFPFLLVGDTDLDVDGLRTSQTFRSDPVVVDLIGRPQLKVANCDLFSPVTRVSFNTEPVSGYTDDAQTPALGGGQWDVTPFLARAMNFSDNWRAANALGATPFDGYMPARTPRLTPAQLAAIADGKGAVGTAPLMFGGMTYKVEKWNMSATSPFFARSAHQFWSYGRDLTAQWSARGNAQWVSMSDTRLMFPGLKITLGKTLRPMVVIGVYPALRGCSVMALSDATRLIGGAPDKLYRDATILQERYVLTER